MEKSVASSPRGLVCAEKKEDALATVENGTNSTRSGLWRQPQQGHSRIAKNSETEHRETREALCGVSSGRTYEIPVIRDLPKNPTRSRLGWKKNRMR